MTLAAPANALEKSKMSQMPNLTAEPRDALGSRASRKARAVGRTPANLYRAGEENQSVTLDSHGLELALATPAQVFEIELSGTKQPCLVREVQYDTYGQQVLHVDFARVALDEEVGVEVPFEIRGTPKGVADGGTLSIQHQALMVRCKAGSIPDQLIIDVTSLGVSDSFKAGDIELPEGLSLDTDRMRGDLPVITVLAPRVRKKTKRELAEEQAAAEAAGGDAPADEPAGEG